MATRATTYHRDDLRGDLLRAGRAYIAEHGHSALSVRTLAQSVGVSPGAPYHHFRDRRALLLALALDGYGELTAMANDANRVSDSPEDVLIENGLQFIRFATKQPRLLELMYESELTSPTTDQALTRYQHAGRNSLIKPLRLALPNASDEDLSVRVLGLWSTIYGFASLRRKEMLKEFEPSQLENDEVARRVIRFAVHAALERS